MSFFKRNCVCKRELEELKSEISSLRLDIEREKSHIISLRGLVNRLRAEKGGAEEETKDLYSGMLLPENR